MQNYYLTSNVQLEPLFHSWYVWSHLIPPATAARNLTERHLKIMDSYISDPSVHANAVKNPQLQGGPFIDHDGGRVDEIKELRARTIEKAARLLQLSAALGELDGLLRKAAKGYSLVSLYQKIPSILRGYVELVYDLDNRPSFRLVESLLYRSPFYDRSAQSFLLSTINGDDRPFVLSTPRLDQEGSLHVHMPFDSEAVDQLFALKSRPQPVNKVKELLNLDSRHGEALDCLLTAEPPQPYQRYKGNGVRWRYFGHACILIETKSVSMLFDPVLSYTYESGISRYTYNDLPPSIDYVLITHNHQDHVLFETLLQIRHSVKTVVVPKSAGNGLQDPSLKLALQNCGFKNVIEIDDFQQLGFDDGEIVGIPFFGEHGDLDVRCKSAYLVRVGGHSLLFAADSCNIEPILYKHIHEQIGNVDALFLGMECDGAPFSWLYGPLLTRTIERSMDQSRRLCGSDYRQAVQIVDELNCKEVYIYAMGQEPWLNYVMSIKYTDQSRPIIESNKLIKHCRDAGICSERLFGEKEILLD